MRGDMVAFVGAQLLATTVGTRIVVSMVAADPACPTPSGDDQAEMEGDGDAVVYSGQNGATPPPLPTAEESLIGGAKRMRTSDERERDAAAVMRAAASKWLRDTQDGVQPAPMAGLGPHPRSADRGAAGRAWAAALVAYVVLDVNMR